MENKQYLNEERYQKNRDKLIRVAFLILILGILVGGGLIVAGIKKYNDIKSDTEQSKVDKEASTINRKQELITKIAAEETKLLARKKELDDKGIKFNAFTDYTDVEAYELKVITRALDPSFDYWKFSECKNHATTRDYCSLKEEFRNIEWNESIDEQKQQSGFYDTQSNIDNTANVVKVAPLFMFGGFIIIASFIGAGSIYAFAKRREIQAFTTQQSILVEKEKIGTMTPTYADAVKDIAKAVTEGIKEGKE